MRESGILVEVTALLVPEYNDSEEQVRQMAKIIKGIDAGIPWHLSRFFPAYKMSGYCPTSVDKIVRARDIGFEGGEVRIYYIGNVPDNDGENTYCPSCRKFLIKRHGYTIMENNAKSGKCPFCGYPLDGQII